MLYRIKVPRASFFSLIFLYCFAGVVEYRGYCSFSSRSSNQATGTCTDARARSLDSPCTCIRIHEYTFRTRVPEF